MDDSAAVLSAAEQGQGLALARWSLVATEIEQGRLIAASRHCVAHRLAYYFVCPEPYLMLSKVSQLREWLRDEMRKFPKPPGVEPHPAP